ncbi:hypothetical protein ONS95_008521 [Cadophora gregata]|uniref:uncharacterized protein n=1 Tax=Cadophora gregata TaxID=51156 RepID=UPI0026DAA1EA|nr:uncharacterized protein ONS95_008521 [Cadophora gregata]KAK0100183.1 hypothetical protein ONS95_008521 [Cadophora gregata]
MPDETVAENIRELELEKKQLLKDEDKQRYVVDEAWLERCEAWNRFQESGMKKGQDEYHQMAAAWQRVSNAREGTRLRVRRIELDIKALRKQGGDMQF